MHTESLKAVRVSQGTKNFAVQLLFQINVTLCSASKPKENYEIVNIFGFHS
jgi:hypothetical protein